tara:strand:+ start:1630 stop:1860 length:231 start_codon:yes stop_codon:yes gene_type:complete
MSPKKRRMLRLKARKARLEARKARLEARKAAQTAKTVEHVPVVEKPEVEESSEPERPIVRRKRKVNRSKARKKSKQ